MNALIIGTITGGLLLDQHWARYGQLVVSAFTWLLFLALWRQCDRGQRPALFACLLFATAGEVFLSLVWGLYEYRLGNIPLFVPPGHVLLFFLGTQIAGRMPDGREWWIAGLALPVVFAFAWVGRDTLGPLLYALFLGFVLSLAMELYGTWMGNWIWSAQVPWLGLRSDNPPIAAGAFYCVLDLLVVTVASRTGVVSVFSPRRASVPTR
jgi:hypothetical protein